MSILHIGQVRCSNSQGSTQLLWNSCRHGSIRTTSDGLYGSMHTAQQSPSPTISCKTMNNSIKLSLTMAVKHCFLSYTYHDLIAVYALINRTQIYKFTYNVLKRVHKRLDDVLSHHFKIHFLKTFFFLVFSFIDTRGFLCIYYLTIVQHNS